jgi:hypothetical protein
MAWDVINHVMKNETGKKKKTKMLVENDHMHVSTRYSIKYYP